MFMLLFFGYLGVSNSIFNKWIKTKGESYLVENLRTQSKESMRFHIDACLAERTKWKESVKIKGWAVKGKRPLKERDLFLVLIKDVDTLTFLVPKDNLKRKNLTEKFELKGGNVYHGFEAIIPMAYLTEGEYKLGVGVKDDNGYSYKRMSGMLKVDGLSASIKKRDSAALLTSKGERKVTYRLDKVHVGKNYVNIEGWGIIPNLSTSNQSIKIILKSSNEELSFKTETVKRKDVTKHFKDMSVNLNNSGFKVKIPRVVLKDKSYSLKVVIIKDGDEFVSSKSSLVKLN